MNCSNSPRIVIADDDADLIHGLAICCSGMGLDVHAAYDTSSAWKKIELVRPNLVVLDVDMPEGVGLSICEMMAHHDKLKHIPAILLTGKSDCPTVRHCHEMMVYYVPKCANIWTRLKPLICEILEEQQCLKTEPAIHPEETPRKNNGIEKLMDAVFANLGSDYHEESDDVSAGEPLTTSWVLCIDDDDALAHGLKLRLKEQGVELLRASAGMEGYRRAFLTPADLIILDYEMPNGNGDYVLGRLKDNPVTRDIPVIVLTGRREKTLERKMYAMGASCFLTKPYNWSELWDEIRKYLIKPTISVGRK